MADPYGFPESTPESSNGSAPLLALWCGVGASLCMAVGPCMCYMPYFLAFPLTFLAILYGWKGYTSLAGLEKQTAMAGLLMGLVCGILLLFFTLMIVAYLIFMVVSVAATQSGL
jgi:hypothetical protein